MRFFRPKWLKNRMDQARSLLGSAPQGSASAQFTRLTDSARKRPKGSGGT